MKTREDDIQEVCSQVISVGLHVNCNNWYASCPFCGNGDYVDEISQIKHHSDCAYLIAKDLSAGFKLK